MTANNSHVGVKLAAEMERLGLKPAQIATLFEVKVPSVYDWLKHGRIHKKHYPALVAMSGRSLEWWLGMPEVAPMPPTRALRGSCEHPGANDSRHKQRHHHPAHQRIATIVLR